MTDWEGKYPARRVMELLSVLVQPWFQRATRKEAACNFGFLEVQI